MSNALKDLAGSGVAVWLDDLSRTRIQSGSLAGMVERGDIVGITTNPTMFGKALGEGAGYEDQVRDLAMRGTAIGETLRLLTAWDVRAACDILRPVFERTQGLDGRVSIEVDPRLAQNAEKTAAEARGLWWLVDRPNLFIKIPATLAGLPAIKNTIAGGISVNVTLIFSLERYRAVLDAYMSGLEHRVSHGLSVLGLESVASFFVSRVDTEVDRRLAEHGEPPAGAADIKGKVALANCRLAYEVYEEALASARWKSLERQGARMQRLLWASTGVKDKALPDTLYVSQLVAPNTVNTMPEATLKAVEEHGDITGDTIADSFKAARETIAQLRIFGVDIDDVARSLEEAGLSSFEASWNELIASVTKRIEEAGAKVTAAGASIPKGGASASDRQPAAGPPADARSGE